MQLPTSAPSGLTVSGAGSLLQLTWVNNASTTASGFNIERKSGAAGTWMQVGTTSSPTAVSFLDAATTVGITYFYRVRASSIAGGLTAYSPEASRCARATCEDCLGSIPDGCGGTLSCRCPAKFLCVSGTCEYNDPCPGGICP